MICINTDTLYQIFFKGLKQIIAKEQNKAESNIQKSGFVLIVNYSYQDNFVTCSEKQMSHIDSWNIMIMVRKLNAQDKQFTNDARIYCQKCKFNR